MSHQIKVNSSKVLIDWTEFDRDNVKRARIHTANAVYPEDADIIKKEGERIVVATTKRSRDVYAIPREDRFSQTIGYGYHLVSYQED